MGRTVIRFGLAALVLAILRYFTKGWLDTLGLPVAVGSLVASVTVVLLVSIGILFHREGVAADGSYLRAAAWFFLLAAWCEVLVIAGILITEKTGADTYYIGPWESVREVFPTASAHAVGHAQGFAFRTAFGLILGAVVYFLARRRRPQGM